MGSACFQRPLASSQATRDCGLNELVKLDREARLLPAVQLAIDPACGFLGLIASERPPRGEPVKLLTDISTQVEVGWPKKIGTEAGEMKPERDHVAQPEQMLKALEEVHGSVVPPALDIQVWPCLVTAISGRLEHEKAVPRCDNDSENAADFDCVVVLQQLRLLTRPHVEI